MMQQVPFCCICYEMFQIVGLRREDELREEQAANTRSSSVRDANSSGEEVLGLKDRFGDKWANFTER